MKDSLLDRMPEGKSLKDLRFWGGFGEAVFNMRHGSFKIKDKVQSKIPLALLEHGDNLTLTDAQHLFSVSVRLNDDKGVTAIEFLQTKGTPFTRFWISLPASEDERIYGCGECFSEFDLKGKTARIWVAEHQNISRIMGKVIRNTIRKPKASRKLPFEKYETYYVQPTFTSSDKYFVHADSDAYMAFHFEADTHLLYMHALPKALYIGRSESYEGLSLRLSEVLGRQPLVPKWINDGLILAVQGGSDTIRHKIKTAMDAGIPIAGVWSQDWCGVRMTSFGRQVMWNWKADESLYPGMDTLMAELKAKGIRFLGYINPFIAIEGELYRYASEKGYCIKDKDGKDYLATTTTFPAAMIDFTNPAAYAWYKDIIKTNMIGFGLSGWMADFGEYMPVDARLSFSDDNAQTHNRWPAIWATVNREALEETGRQEDIFFFTRAGHTGTVRDSMMMWNGDQHVDWSEDDGLPSAITATLSLAMSGFGIAHSDIGGYTTMPKCQRGQELLMRWTELAAFSPVMRMHEGNRPGDNAQFDHSQQTLTHISKMTRVHVALKEYINDCILQNHRAGTPVMRPLFYHYDEEPLYRQQYAYLLGRDLACYPVVVQGQAMKEVHLPDDEWVHLFTGAAYTGGSVTLECPLGCPPIFYRKTSAYKEMFEKVGEMHERAAGNQ